MLFNKTRKHIREVQLRVNGDKKHLKFLYKEKQYREDLVYTNDMLVAKDDSALNGLFPDVEVVTIRSHLQVLLDKGKYKTIIES